MHGDGGVGVRTPTYPPDCVAFGDANATARDGDLPIAVFSSLYTFNTSSP
jgi:hypothetical protein